MGEEEGRDGKLLVLPAEPQLLAAIPSQGVDVGEESGLLHVLQEGVVVDFYYSDMPETYNLIAKYKSVYKMTGRAIVGL